MLLQLKEVTVRLGEDTVLRNLDLAVDGVGLIALMGPSGVGKTTLLRLIAGLISPSAGVRRADAKIATIFQDARLLPWQSALDNAAFGLRAQGMARQTARLRAADILARLGFSGADMIKYPRALSGGMRQRVAIARALAIKPDLLLMDEPFTGLDAPLRADLQGLVREIVAEKHLAAILVTHDPVEAVMLADRIILLGGRPASIVADLPGGEHIVYAADAYRAAADLMRRPEIAKAFEVAGHGVKHKLS
jgi:NitT/TauT family transport system ATP-binding protein